MAAGGGRAGRAVALVNVEVNHHDAPHAVAPLRVPSGHGAVVEDAVTLACSRIKRHTALITILFDYHHPTTGKKHLLFVEFSCAYFPKKTPHVI